MSHPESGHLATDESHLRLELNERLSALGATVTNLKEDLQDGVLLLALLNQASIQEASNFHKRKRGKRSECRRPLPETQAMGNRRTLCKILNQHGKKFGSSQEFRETDIFTLHAAEAVRLVLRIANESQEAKVFKWAKNTPREKHDNPSAHPTGPVLEWINYHLSKIDLQALNLENDLHDGFFLIHLVEIVTGENISNFHSRLAKDVPIGDIDAAAKNRKCLLQWLKSEGENTELTKFNALFQAVIWNLVSISLGGKEIEKSSGSRLNLAKNVFSELGIPFFFQHLDLKGKGTEVLLASSILKDKFEILKAGDKGKKFEKWAAPPQRYMTNTPLSDRILEEGVLRIFLSSTFRDMQRERDVFFTNGAPKLKSLAKSKGLDIVFIDLRWGLTAEESGDGKVVIRCCDSIKKCAYFVCFLGARYGWVPDRNKTELNKEARLQELKKTKPDATMKDIWVEWHSTTNQEYPFLDDMPNLSVTEYEIQYATLIDKPACSRGLFYFRDEQFAIDNALTEEDRKLYNWETDADVKLSSEERQKARRCQDELKAKVKAKFGAVTYKGPANFSDLVTSHLSYLIDKDFSGRQVREPEDQAHHQFMQHRLAGFEGRQELLKTIVGQVDEQLESKEKQITVLAAESGIGKSSLMAATVRDLNKLQRQDMHVFFHFVGCTNLSNYVESISIRFWKCIMESNSLIKIQLKDMTEADFQKEGIQGLFKFLEMNIPNHKFVFLIDAINQLHPSQETPVPHLLTWLPKKAPKNVALVVSTIDTHASCKTIQSMNIDAIPVTKLKNQEIKQGTKAFLDRYDKKVSEEQMQLILDDAQDTGHPLYLRLVLEEIRIFGVFEKLTEELKKLLSTDGVIELYNMIITRWENKFNKEDAEMVDIAMKVLFVSRIGLSEGDLDKYVNDKIGMKFNLAEWKTFFFTLIESLFVRNGRYMYFHQLLLETVQKRYFESSESLKSAQKYYGMWLYGQCADANDADEEVVAEICHQLLNGESYDALVEYLKKEHVVESMLGGRYRYEFFNCWRKIHEKGAGNYKDTYKSLVQSLTKAGDLLVEFFLEAFETSFLISNIPIRMAKRLSEESKVGDYLTLGRVYKNIQSWDESLQNLKKCMDIKIHLKQKDESVASILDEIGNVNLQQKRFEDASQQFLESLNLRKELFGENDVRVAQSYDNIGHLQLIQKKFEESIKSFKIALEIRAKVVGQDHPLMATSFTNLAKVDIAENRLQEALGKLEKAKQIWESSLGSKHHSVASVLCLIASIHEIQNQKQKAVNLLYQASEMFVESVGENHPNTVSAFEKIGDLEHDMKKYNEALDAYKKVLEIRKRTIGEKNADYATALENVARTNCEMTRNDQVAEFITPAMKIRSETKTKSSFKDVTQCARIARLMEEKKFEEEAIFLYKEAIIPYCQNQSYESLSAWKMCENVDELLKSAKKHQEAIEFWTEKRDMFEEKLHDTHQHVIDCCINIGKHQENTDIAESIKSYRSAITKYCQKESYESLGARKICENVDKKLRHTKKHQEAIEFWTEMRDMFEQNLGWMHERTLLCCEYLASHFKEIGQNKQPIEFTKVAKFINEETGTQIDSEKFEYEKVTALLFSIVYSSRTDITKSKASSIAITLLNFMNFSFSGLDLSGVRIPNANLSRSDVDGTNFTGADLSGVKFNEACLGSCIFNESNMECVKFGNIAKDELKGHMSSIRSACSVNGPNGECWLASGSDDRTIRIWDVATGSEIKTLNGHTSSVNSVCSVNGPNGECWLASGSADETIRIWDISTGLEIKTLNGHTSSVNSVCSVNGPNGECWLASGSDDKTIRIWDIATGSEIKTLNGHTIEVNSVCSVNGPNGECWLASGSANNTIRIWDIATGSEIKTLNGHTSYVYSVCSLNGPNGECWLASGSDDKTIRIWDIATGSEIKTFNGHTSFVLSVCSVNGPNGECWLASGSANNTIRIWDIATGSEIKTLNGHTSYVYSVCSLNGPNGECWLASGSDDNTIRIWDIATGSEIKTFNGHTSFVFSVCSVNGPNGECWLASGSHDNTIRIWDIATGSEIKTLHGHTNDVSSVCNVDGPNGECWLASGSYDRTIHIWDIASGLDIKTLNGHTSSVRSVCSVKGPNGECWLASGSRDETIRIWDIATGLEIKTLNGHTRPVNSVCSVKGPNGECWLVSGSGDNTIRIWDVATGSEIKTLNGHTDSVFSVCSVKGPNGECWLASGSNDNTIRIWDVASGSEIKTLNGHTHYVFSVCSLNGPNGECWLASGSADKTIRIWDLATGSEIKTLKGHTTPVYSVCSVNGPNGECWLTSGSADKTIRIWDIATGLEIKTLNGFTEYVRSVCSVNGPNGECWLASGSYDNTIRIWDVATGSEIKTLNGHTSAVYSICRVNGPNGECWLASGSSDSTIRIWDIATGLEIKTLNGHTYSVLSVCSVNGPNGECWLASGSDDRTIRIWDIATGSEIKTLNGHSGSVNSICSVNGPNGECWLASGSDDNTIRIWDISTGLEIKTLNGHTNWLTSVCSVNGPNGECWLASGSGDATICVWDIATGSEIKTLNGHTSNVYSVCRVNGPNGECWLVSGSGDNTIHIWDIATGSEIKTLNGHTDSVTSVCSVNGPNDECWLASGSHDKTIHIWDIATGSEIHKLEKAEATYTKDAQLVRKDEPDFILAQFQSIGVAMQMVNTEKIMEVRTKHIIGPRRLEGGDVQLRNVIGLSKLNKNLLLQIGGVSFDYDFVEYCESGKFTKFQAQMMAQCYAEGWGMERDFQKAHYWTFWISGKALDFESLKQHAQNGSKEAFDVLLKLAEEIDDDEDSDSDEEGIKHPQAAKIVAECYSEGWGVEKNARKAAKWLSKLR